MGGGGTENCPKKGRANIRISIVTVGRSDKEDKEMENLFPGR